MKNAHPLYPRKALTFALMLGISSLGAAVAVAADATTPSTTPRDRNDMVNSNDTRTNAVGRQSDMNQNSSLSHSDRRFIEKAAKGGMMEVKLGQLAADHSSDPRVKSFGEKLVQDHTKANQELAELAQRKGVTLPNEDTDNHMFRSLSEKTGADFDKRFINHMVDDHEDDIDMFQKEARKADDPDVAAFASKQLPVLQEHKRMAQDIQNSLKR